jgi:hypothetical protein
MDSKNVIETFGTISKKEILASIEEEFCNGALVLESKFPYPGYYHDTIPDTADLNPRSIFIITRRLYQEENVIRINHEVKKSFRKRFDAALGEVMVFNEKRPCIRVKFLEDYKYIPELITLYQNQGIHFLTYRKVNPYYDLIKIRRFFSLESPEPGIYFDMDEKQICFFQTPGYFKWHEFEKTTLDLKRNIEDNKFDAAIGTIYRKNCLVDLVRIYDENISIEKIRFLRSKYIEAVKKYRKK